MTSEADTVDASICILVDEWPDGYIDQFGWVKVTSLTPTPEAAIARLQREFPIDEQGQGGEQQAYVVLSRVWQRCVGVPDEHGVVLVDAAHPVHGGAEYHWPEVPWEECEEGDDRAEEFWKIEVTDEPTSVLARQTDA